MSLIPEKIKQHPLVQQYRSDLRFKGMVAIYRSLAINVFYAIFKAITAFVYHSPWFGTLAFYYIMLSIQRFLLIRGTYQKNIGQKREWLKYIRCGVLLLVLSIALYGAAVLATHRSIASNYPGFLIYLMAGYAFYTVYSAISNLVKYRKLKSPLLSASKVLGVVTAMVSMYSLQASMLEVYSDDPAYSLRMNAITGSVVLGLVILIGVYMIIYGYAKYKK